jgi:hypothetical protein
MNDEGRNQEGIRGIDKIAQFVKQVPLKLIIG